MTRVEQDDASKEGSVKGETMWLKFKRHQTLK